MCAQMFYANWRDEVRKASAGPSGSEPSEPEEEHILGESPYESIWMEGGLLIPEGGRVTIKGHEYWVDPAKSEASAFLSRSRLELAGLGTAKGVYALYDYHASTHTKDLRMRFLEQLGIFGEDVQRGAGPFGSDLEWVNCYSSSKDPLRWAMVEYLRSFIDHGKALRIADMVDDHVRNRASLLGSECSMNDIAIGMPYFNEIFYSTMIEAAEALMPSELERNIILTFADDIRVFANFTKPENRFVSTFDECATMVFDTDLEGHGFEKVSWMKFERHWRCSAHDLRSYLIPYILLISNWSLVLGAYLCVSVFGSCAVTVSK